MVFFYNITLNFNIEFQKIAMLEPILSINKHDHEVLRDLRPNLIQAEKQFNQAESETLF